MKLIGIILIAFGLFGLAFGGLSYTQHRKIAEFGPFQATAEIQKTIPIAPIAGLAALLSGIGLVLMSSKVLVRR